MGFDKNPFKKKYTDADGHPIDKHGNRIDVEEHDVPMYRAYGKHRVYRAWVEKLNDILIKGVALLFLGPILAGFVLFGISIFYYAKMYPFLGILATPILIFISAVIYIKVFRIPRKRIGYKLEIKRNCFQSLKWSERGDVDMIIKAGGWTYYIKFFGSRHALSDVTFWFNGNIVYRMLRKRNLYSRLLNLQPKEKTKKIVFPNIIEGERTVKVAVLNPEPGELYKKLQNGDRMLSGNHDTVFGYTVFTSDGFIDGIRRNIETDKWKKENEKH